MTVESIQKCKNGKLTPIKKKKKGRTVNAFDLLQPWQKQFFLIIYVGTAKETPVKWKSWL